MKISEKTYEMASSPLSDGAAIDMVGEADSLCTSHTTVSVGRLLVGSLFSNGIRVFIGQHTVI